MSICNLSFESLPFVTLCDRGGDYGEIFIKQSESNYPLILFKSYRKIIQDLGDEELDVSFVIEELPEFDVIKLSRATALDRQLLSQYLKVSKKDGKPPYKFFDHLYMFRMCNLKFGDFKVFYDSGLFTVYHSGTYFNLGIVSFDSRFKEYMKMLYHYPNLVTSEFYENQIFKFEYLSSNIFDEYLFPFVGNSIHSSSISGILNDYQRLLDSIVNYFESLGVECQEVKSLGHFFSYPKPIIKSFDDTYKVEEEFRKNLLSLSINHLLGYPTRSNLVRVAYTDISRLDDEKDFDEYYLKEYQVRKLLVNRRVIHSMVNERVKL